MSAGWSPARGNRRRTTSGPGRPFERLTSAAGAAFVGKVLPAGTRSRAEVHGEEVDGHTRRPRSLARVTLGGDLCSTPRRGAEGQPPSARAFRIGCGRSTPYELEGGRRERISSAARALVHVHRSLKLWPRSSRVEETIGGPLRKVLPSARGGPHPRRRKMHRGKVRRLRPPRPLRMRSHSTSAICGMRLMRSQPGPASAMRYGGLLRSREAVRSSMRLHQHPLAAGPVPIASRSLIARPAPAESPSRDGAARQHLARCGPCRATECKGFSGTPTRRSPCSESWAISMSTLTSARARSTSTCQPVRRRFQAERRSPARSGKLSGRARRMDAAARHGRRQDARGSDAGEKVSTTSWALFAMARTRARPRPCRPYRSRGA